MRERQEAHKQSMRITRTPPPLVAYKPVRKDEDDEKEERKRDKKSRDEPKKRKKEHRSRSKSRERKKRKDKKHKKDKKHGKDKDTASKDKSGDEDKDGNGQTAGQESGGGTNWKKQRRNPRLVPDRKRSILDEASFEPDYSASDSDSEEDDRSTLIATKRAKVDDAISIDSDNTTTTKPIKKRSKVRFFFGFFNKVSR